VLHRPWVWPAAAWPRLEGMLRGHFFGERLVRGDTDAPWLAKLPKAVMGVRVPSAPSEAFPWLLDQITLLSDADILKLSA